MNLHPRLSVFALVLVCFSAAACAPVAIRGTVIEGPISMIAVVDPDDPRLSQPGIAEATITVQQTGVIGPITERRSGEEGRFRLPLDGTGALSRPMSMQIAAEGYLAAVEPTMPTPGNDQRVLVVLQPMRQPSP
ncbi:MAG: hypothetical protein AAGF47_00885 [Planctomycetota bacterium]